MIFKTRPGIKKQFDTDHDFGIANLIVSGCSFSFNNHESCAVTWPYYLRDIGGFKEVFDCSLPGAGNYHISNALIWALENDRLDAKNSLVIVMWSGNDRDDHICPTALEIESYPFRFDYSAKTMSGITGGSHLEALGNTVNKFKEFTVSKSRESRAIENYLYIIDTWHYLKSSGFKFIFLEFLTGDLPSRTCHFDIKKYLPTHLANKLSTMIENIADPYAWALKNDLLNHADNFHPSPQGHLSWTKNVLLPHMRNRESS